MGIFSFREIEKFARGKNGVEPTSLRGEVLTTALLAIDDGDNPFDATSQAPYGHQRLQR